MKESFYYKVYQISDMFVPKLNNDAETIRLVHSQYYT